MSFKSNSFKNNILKPDFNNKNNKNLLKGLLFISLAALMLEIALIRIISLTYNYSFSMLIISISLFGMSAGGSFLYIKNLKKPYYISCICFSLSALLGYYIFSQISFDPTKASYNYLYAYPLFFYYILFAIPFFFFGIILTHAFIKFKNESGKIYFSNLLGSAMGSALALLVVSFFGISSINVAAIFGLIASIFFSKNKFQKTIIFLLIVFVFSLNLPINISDSKEIVQALNIQGSEHIDSAWNSFSRVDIINSSFTRYAPGLSLNYNKSLPSQLGVLVDGGSMTAFSEKDNHDFTSYLPSYIGFELLENPKTLIINPQGGPDIIAAKKNNATTTIIENNPLVVSMIKKHYEFSGPIYEFSNVININPRKYLKNSNEYDLIIISLTGNVDGSGIQGINQNYDFTKEGLGQYYKKLSDNGYLIITRWLTYPPKESLRLFSLAKEITEEKNIAMFRSLSTVTLVIGKNLDTKKIIDFNNKNNFDIIFLEDDFTPNIYNKFNEPIFYNYINEFNQNKSFAENYIFDISPPTDDRPFYFNFFKIDKMSELHQIMGKNWQAFNDPGFILIFLFVQATILSLIFIIFPIFVKKKSPSKKNFFFICTGIAYMLILINLIQNSVKLFGNIAYASAFIIAIILTSSSIGSYLSKKIKLNIVFFILIPYLFLLFLYLNKIIYVLMNFNIFFGLTLYLILLIPLGFLMGIPFPKGLEVINKKDVPWAFALDGATSVLSSIAGLIIAIFFGFSVTLLISMFFYSFGFFIIKNKNLSH